MKTESPSTTSNSTSDTLSSSHISGTCYPLPKHIPDLPFWVIDSGASVHICYSRELFTFINLVTGFNVSFSEHT